jgi:uncharacterized protein YegP (UPF0339 family)
MPPEDIAQIYRDTAGLYRFRILARNGEIIAEGESYGEKHHATDVIQAHFPYASIVDLTIEENE